MSQINFNSLILVGILQVDIRILILRKIMHDTVNNNYYGITTSKWKKLYL